MEELKRVEIENGKFTLEGKVVEVEPLKLEVIELKLLYLNLKIKDSIKDLSSQEVSEVAKMVKRKNYEVKKLYEKRPEEANVYVIGREPYERFRGGWGSFDGNNLYYYPILYLKIKGENGDDQ